MLNMKIGLIRETKTPEDNRVALSPAQLAFLQREYPQDEFVVQSSSIRAFGDDEYQAAGLRVVEDVSDCDILFGIKEANIDTLLPDKHYFFFGHIAKMQEYNRPLLQAMLSKRLTFSDYEYLVDDHNQRVCAFGWWAGVVGVYYTLRGYGLKNGCFQLPKPDRRFTLEALKSALKAVKLPAIRVLITGNGRVSHGAQHVMEAIGARQLSECEFLSNTPIDTLSYCVADADRLVLRNDGGPFCQEEFFQHPELYHSDFMRWGRYTDMLICGHFWTPQAPVYLTQDDLRNPDLRIRFIGDVTCDIQGSIKSTLRSSTHDDPYYDYNPVTEKEDPCFSSAENISVMAVDTCPNALAMDTSAYFGDMLLQHVFTPLLQRKPSDIIQRSTIVEKGQLTPRFDYLHDFSKIEQ